MKKPPSDFVAAIVYAGGEAITVYVASEHAAKINQMVVSKPKKPAEVEHPYVTEVAIQKGVDAGLITEGQARAFRAHITMGTYD